MAKRAFVVAALMFRNKATSISTAIAVLLVAGEKRKVKDDPAGAVYIFSSTVPPLEEG